MVDLLGWFAMLVLPAFLVVDFVVRGRRYDAARGWRLRALAVSVAVFFVSMKVGELWGAWTGAFSLVDGSVLGTAGGALVGILVYELFHYGYHRLAHRWTFLWRAAHQMHHSPESHDAFGANYLHPLDAALFTTIASLTFFPLLGLSPEAGAIANAFLAFNAGFQHANIRTPRWLGYIVQRPESHVLHHARRVQDCNYADLPLWDMVFGTFRNPSRVDLAVGFWRGASARVPSMLVGIDVTQLPTPGAPAEAPLSTDRGTPARRRPGSLVG